MDSPLLLQPLPTDLSDTPAGLSATQGSLVNLTTNLNLALMTLSNLTSALIDQLSAERDKLLRAGVELTTPITTGTPSHALPVDDPVVEDNVWGVGVPSESSSFSGGEHEAMSLVGPEIYYVEGWALGIVTMFGVFSNIFAIMVIRDEELNLIRNFAWLLQLQVSLTLTRILGRR